MNRGSNSGRSERSALCRLSLGLTQSPVQLVLVYFSGGKRPEGIVDHTPPSMRSAEVKNELRYNLPFSIYLHSMDREQMYPFFFHKCIWYSDQLWSRPGSGEKTYMLLKVSRVVLWPTHPSVKCALGALFPVVKWPGHESDYLNHLMPSLRMSGSIPPLSIFLQGIYLYL